MRFKFLPLGEKNRWIWVGVTAIMEKKKKQQLQRGCGEPGAAMDCDAQ